MKRFVMDLPVKRLAFIFCTGFFIILSIFMQPDQSQKTKKQTVVSPGSLTDCSKDTGLSKVVCLAEAFKATLKDDQLSLLQLDYSKSSAVRWSNFPQKFSHPDRVGISLGSLNPAQLAAFKALIVSVLSQNPKNEGYDEMEGIRAADNVIAKATGKTDAFGSGNYYIAFLGKPSAASLWELQFGGHHYAFANTYKQGKIEGVTPSFRGIDPLTPFSENGNTYQPLAQEQTNFAGIIKSLSDPEKNAARLSATFSDVLLGPGKDGEFPQAKEGLKIGNLSGIMQQQITRAIELYAGDLDSITSETIMTRYKAELKDTYFAYSGSGTMNQLNDYVRLDGPGIWLELSLQPSRDFPGTNHIHSVWRDRKTDYGGN